MATKFTPRLQLPYPADAAEGWYSAFADFATGVDTALLGVLEANAWAFSALPDATIESDGGTGYQLTLAGPFTAIGRTFGTPVTVLAGSTAMTPTWLLGVTVPTGATAPSTATLTCIPSAATIDPAFRVLGYVNADSSATWWNAGTHAVGATQRLFAVGGGGAGSGEVVEVVLAAGVPVVRTVAPADASTLFVCVPSAGGTVTITLPAVADAALWNAGDRIGVLALGTTPTSYTYVNVTGAAAITLPGAEVESPPGTWTAAHTHLLRARRRGASLLLRTPADAWLPNGVWRVTEAAGAWDYETTSGTAVDRVDLALGTTLPAATSGHVAAWGPRGELIDAASSVELGLTDASYAGDGAHAPVGRLPLSDATARNLTFQANSLLDALNKAYRGEGAITWSGTTTNDTATEIFLGGIASTRYALATSSTVLFQLTATARDNVNNLTKVWLIEAVTSTSSADASAFVRLTPTYRVIDQHSIVGGTNDWAIAVSVNDGDDTFRVTVTGAPGSTIQWLVSN
jgi:hypothetical protein